MHVNEVTIYRCWSCKKIITDVELKGGCPLCHGNKVEGAPHPSKLELLRLYIRLLFIKDRK
jgi:Zn finger protein HypA/HybF involved in hydrogenase expression